MKDKPCAYHKGIAALRKLGVPVKAEVPGNDEVEQGCRACRLAVIRFEAAERRSKRAG
jgi:hypothetical protein